MTVAEFKELLLTLINKTKKIIENSNYDCDIKKLPLVDIAESFLQFLDITEGSYDSDSCQKNKEQYRNVAGKLWMADSYDVRQCYKDICYTEMMINMLPSEQMISAGKDEYNMVMARLFNSIMTTLSGPKWWNNLYGRECDEEIKELLSQISKKGSVQMLNFYGEEKYDNLEVLVEYDSETGMPYTVYMGKNMYFPVDHDVQNIRRYVREKYEEQDISSAHCYKNVNCPINEGDIVLDIGGAEGNFSLEYIDKVGHVYIAEPEDCWQEPLRKTFAEYLDKITSWSPRTAAAMATVASSGASSREWPMPPVWLAAASSRTSTPRTVPRPTPGARVTA